MLEFECVYQRILSWKLERTGVETLLESAWGCCKMDNPNFEEPRTKKKKSAMSPSGRGKMRSAPPKSPGNMSKICSGYVPPTTKRYTKWAIRVFDQWQEERNTRRSEQCPLDLLEKPSTEALNHWLPQFIAEARRSDGDPYPPSTLSNILAGLYRFAKDCNQNCPKFMD